MARGPIIISSGSRNKPLRSYLSSDQRGEVYCYQVHPNQTAHIHWSWMPRWPCVWFCAYALWNPFRRGGGADLRTSMRTRERMRFAQEIDVWVRKELVPRNLSQGQGTLLPYVYVLLGLQLVMRVLRQQQRGERADNTIVEQTSRRRGGKVENCNQAS